MAALDGDGSRCTIIGTQPRSFGRGLVTKMRGAEHERIEGDFKNCVRRMEHLTSEWMDPLSHDTFQKVMEGNEEMGTQLKNEKKSQRWHSMACGKNVSLCVHTDDDFTLGVVQVVGEEGEDGMDDAVLAHFCFPTLSRCIAMRSCDVLVFNAALDHCIGSRVDGSKSVQCVSFCMSHIVPGGKDNTVSVCDDIQIQILND